VVLGARGQLGREVARRAPSALALGSAECDIIDADAVAEVVRAGDVVVNCAAYTAVDRAETEVDAAFAVNELGPRTLARRCAEVGARLIHVSTDFVFDGRATAPYDTDAATGPANVYGRSKLAGEAAVHAALPSAHVVRTAWVYSGAAGDFVATMLRKEREGATVTVVDDRFGSPTYAGDLAAALLELVARPDAPVLLHAVGAGVASWFELARAVFREVGADPERVRPCRGTDYPTPAARPDYSVLSTRSWTAAGLSALPPWPEALHRALASPAPV
jgi:dTDP-4-dehydrorhamnose reductase